MNSKKTPPNCADCAIVLNLRNALKDLRRQIKIEANQTATAVSVKLDHGQTGGFLYDFKPN